MTPDPLIEDIERECTAIFKVACPHCRAPAGSHCASLSNTIVWPPHLCRMDAYTHRLHPSEDWPATYQVALIERLDYVKNVPAPKLEPLLWGSLVEPDLTITNELSRLPSKTGCGSKHHED